MAAAFGWMVKERVAVINMSLVGPRNALLERAIAVLVGRGHLIVAAVGNDGPAAPPLFPAAYDGVIGVTAVDAKHRVLIEACRGKHLELRGAGCGRARGGRGRCHGLQAGARHFVRRAARCGLLARVIGRTRSGGQRKCAWRHWTAHAVDLGPRGRDDIYGAGLVAADLPLSAQSR